MSSPKPISNRVPPLRGLFFKCTLMVALCILAVVAVFQFQSFSQSQRHAEDTIRQRAAEVTELLAGQLGGAIKFGNLDAIESSVAAAMETAGAALAQSFVLNNAGEIVASSRKDTADTALSDPQAQTLAAQAIESQRMVFSDDGLSAAMLSHYGTGNDAVGVVVTRWSLAPAFAVLWAETRIKLLTGLAVFATALLMAGYYLRTRMLRPLVRIERAMHAVAKEEYDRKIPYTRRGDEIGVMARRLDQFRNALAEAKEAQVNATYKSAAFEGSSAAMMLVNREGEVMYTNPACQAMISEVLTDLRALWPDLAETLTGSNTNSFARLRPVLQDVLSQTGAVDTGSEPRCFVVRVGARSLRITVNAAHDADGEIFGGVIEWADRTRAERNAAMIGAINSGQAVIEFSKDGAVSGANENLLKMINGKAEDTSVCSLKRMFAGNLEGDPDGEKFARAAFAGDIPPGQYKAYSIHADKTFIVNGNFTVITDPDGTPERVMFIGNNLTEQAEALERTEEDRRRAEAEQSRVVQLLSIHLNKLAEGKLHSDITEDFPGTYEQLRGDFNATVTSLRDTISAVMHNSDSIRNETAEITSAADDLSRRTEKQAATLEETAAALDELTASVRSAAEGADDASTMSAEAQQNAEQGGEVARQAIAAMDGIKTSSQEISKITSVIDDIAFQTNLLALNAGVEAARAGEAGRGFAVVATEVRALAQRSSDAAREINALISSSGEQVQQGVDLVDRTGASLAAIVSSISDISERVANIAASAREQSSGLAEINTAVNELDHVTQQNAAMFEETTAASHALTAEADALVQAVSRFRLDTAAAQHPAATAHPTAPRNTRPARTAAPAHPPVSHGNAALDLQSVSDADGWEEF